MSHCLVIGVFFFFLSERLYVDVKLDMLSFPQCEDCLCWQHGTCMGLLEENVPDKYTCYICRDPPGEGKHSSPTVLAACGCLMWERTVCASCSKQ